MNPEETQRYRSSRRLQQQTLIGGLALFLPPFLLLLWLIGAVPAQRTLLMGLLVWLVLAALLVMAAVRYLLRTRARLQFSRRQLALATAVVERERFIRRLADQLPGLVGYWDAELHCRFANRAYLDWFGKEPKQIIGKHSREVLGEELFRRNEPYMRRALAGELQRFERTITRSDGRLAHTQAHFIPDVVDGTVRGYFVQATDVTELRQREDELARLRDDLETQVALRTSELQASENRFRQVAHSLPQLVWSCDSEGRSDFISAQWLGYTGQTEPSQRGLGWLEQIHPQDRALLDSHWQQAGTPGEPLQVELRIRRHDGVYRWFDTRALALGDASGRTLRWFGSSTDIEERRQMEAQILQRSRELQRSNTALEQFAYAASHDLQEPLRMVTSYTQLIERRYTALLDDNGRQMMGYVVESAKRMRALIHGLLSYARAGMTETGQQTDMRAACLQALTLLDGQIQREQARVELAEHLPLVQADPAAMQQLWQNLIGNALRYRSTQPPLIRIGLRDGGEPGMATFCVADNGIGIAPQYQERVFLLFQSLETDPERRRESTGIGLALCKRVVETCGGRLWVESDGRSGSSFCFTLPLIDTTALAPPTDV